MMLEAIETIKRGDEELRIIQDLDPLSPRDWDNLGTMVCFHSRYDLGDHDHDFWEHSGGDVEGLLEYVNRDDVIALPLCLYDHSGISMSCSSFIGRAQHAEWDSGQVGYIFVTKERVREVYGVKRISPKLLETVTHNLKCEVDTYDQYLRGDIYGYQIVKLVKCECCGAVDEEHIDSCWGFYGDDIKTNGMLDHVGEEWSDAA